MQFAGIQRSRIKTKLPACIPVGGKVQIANGGDTIRSVAGCSSFESIRDSSYIKVCMFKLY